MLTTKGCVKCRIRATLGGALSALATTQSEAPWPFLTSEVSFESSAFFLLMAILHPAEKPQQSALCHSSI